ncbi:MAG TPA: hypothetical protein VFT95_20915 [Micromonosporaceae bacterium]|nr:hypothetical protein [Micromonosporaceae bacterium]
MDIKEMTGGWPVQAVAAAADAATVGVNATFSAVMPFDGTVVGVKMIPSANITANATNFRTLTVRNKGTNGLSGTTAVASRAWSATNSTASTPENFTLNATPANLEVKAGDVLELHQNAAAAGLIIPASSYVILVRPR